MPGVPVDIEEDQDKMRLRQAIHRLSLPHRLVFELADLPVAIRDGDAEVGMARGTSGKPVVDVVIQPPRIICQASWHHFFQVKIKLN